MKDLSKVSWGEHQVWEKAWHNNCVNSYFEETKQIVYAKKMGLIATGDEGRFPSYDMQGKSILDIGGGAYSLLLKCRNYSKATIIDPCDYPEWTTMRYKAAGIDIIKATAEEVAAMPHDEVWMYNLLQHTENPELIIANARKQAPIIRLFDWVGHGVTMGHPQDLKADLLDKWLGGKGTVEDIWYATQFLGHGYFGVFKT